VGVRGMYLGLGRGFINVQFSGKKRCRHTWEGNNVESSYRPPASPYLDLMDAARYINHSSVCVCGGGQPAVRSMQR